MLTANKKALHGNGIAVEQNLKSSTMLRANPLAYSKGGVKTASYLPISSIKMGEFMGLEKQIPVLGWKMKPFLSIMSKIKVSGAVVSLFLLVSSSAFASDTLPFYNSEEFSPHWIAPNSPELKSFHRIPAFSFTNQDGQTIDEKTVENKIYVAGFFFSTCPGICPMIRSKLSKVQETYLDDPQIEILQHSIRPNTDTVEVLKAYANEHGIVSGKWHLVTGDKDAIYTMAKTYYFASEDLGNIQNTLDFLHTENILLIDENRHIRGIYNGLNSASVDDLITDIGLLKAEIVTSN